MAMDSNIVSQVQSLERRPDKVVVEVAALGPVKLEGGMRQRARARALLAAGVLPTSFDTISDVPMGDINRLTNVRGSRKAPEVTFDNVPVLGKLLQKRVYTVDVNRQ